MELKFLRKIFLNSFRFLARGNNIGSCVPSTYIYIKFSSFKYLQFHLTDLSGGSDISINPLTPYGYHVKKYLPFVSYLLDHFTPHSLLYYFLKHFFRIEAET